MIQDLGQYDSWHRVNRQEECLMEEGEDSSIEGSPTVGDGGRAAISLTPDVVGTGSGSLLDSILCIFLKGLPRRLNGKESACQFRRHRKQGLDPRVRKTPWSRKWQPTPEFLSGKSHGQRSLVGYSPWGYKESDTTEHAHT